MTLRLTRREFLGSAALLFALPSNIFAADEDRIVLRFAAMSDVHYSGNKDAPEVERFRKSLDFMYKYSSDKKYPRFDALVVAGDMTNHGTIEQIGPFKADLDAGIKPGTKTILCMGNHEFNGGSKPLWEKTFDVPANTRTVVNGFHFLALSPEKGTCRNGDYAYALDWLVRELDAAVADDPKKPIFLAQHYHVDGTVYGSIDGERWGTDDLRKLLANYPTVVDFSGHSHFPINDPRSAWQREYTAFGTGTLSYFEMEGGKYVKFPPGHRNAAQFYVVEVYDDNSVVVKPYDLISDSFYDIVYTIAEPGNLSKYLYTADRYDKAGKPSWAAGAELDIKDLEPLGAEFVFPQAKDEITVHSYRLRFQKKQEERWTEDFEYYAWSNYFYKPMPEIMEIPLHLLDSETDYRLAVTARNCFGKESEKSLETTFSTPKNPDEPEDKDAAAPRPDVLDVRFTDDGAVNAPKNKASTQKPIITLGEPKIGKDEEHGFLYAAFDGKSDAYKIKFTENDYSRLQRRITMAAKFKIDEFGGKNTSVFANTEAGGYALEINHTKKTLEFWCRVNDRYVIVSHAISDQDYHTAFGVYDGRKVLLYLDGKPVAGASASGPIHYTTNEAARAFCVGADINHTGGASTNFQGRIVYAQVYSWALKPGQVANLSK